MQSIQAVREREGPPTEAARQQTIPETFDVAIVSLRREIETAALRLTDRIGAFILQHTRSVMILTREIFRVVAVMYFLFLFPYFAWGSAAELLLRRGPIWSACCIGLPLIIVPLVGLGFWVRAAATKSGKVRAANVIPFSQPAPNTATVEVQKSPEAVTTDVAEIAAPGPNRWRAAVAKVTSFFHINSRYLNLGRLVYPSLVLGGAAGITLAMMTGAPALKETFLAQPNILLGKAIMMSIERIPELARSAIDTVGAMIQQSGS
jgi:hypothetical protein